jgi:hypothetical protein
MLSIILSVAIGQGPPVVYNAQPYYAGPAYWSAPWSAPSYGCNGGAYGFGGQSWQGYAYQQNGWPAAPIGFIPAPWSAPRGPRPWGGHLGVYWSMPPIGAEVGRR